MRRLLFVDHSYHAKTGATGFLRQLLAPHFEVDVVWDESWTGAPPPDAATLNARHADAIIFFQLLPSLRTLRALHCDNLTWVCMRDGPNFRSSRLRGLRGSPLKILNFCAETHRYFSARGQPSLYTQYWPPPDPAARRPARARPKLFFWPRHVDISWQTLKSLLGAFRPERIILRYAADPGQALAVPSADDIREYNITVLQGWLEHEAYIAQLRDCDIFMAPRPLEGIGQAMLEALRYGLAVIAPDAPTMNEYLRAGHNGWLYDPAQPQPLDFSGWAGFGAAAQTDVAQGHARWLEQAAEVAAFIGHVPARRARWDWRLLKALGR